VFKFIYLRSCCYNFIPRTKINNGFKSGKVGAFVHLRDYVVRYISSKVTYFPSKCSREDSLKGLRDWSCKRKVTLYVNNEPACVVYSPRAIRYTAKYGSWSCFKLDYKLARAYTPGRVCVCLQSESSPGVVVVAVAENGGERVWSCVIKHPQAQKKC